MKVVSNTSPLVFLHHVDCLDLLASCFGQVFVPEAVVTEFGKGQLPENINVHQLSIKDKTFVNANYGALHRGELEAIQLAVELNADFVLLDDLLARKKAKLLNVKVIGTLGVFLFAAVVSVCLISSTNLRSISILLLTRTLLKRFLICVLTVPCFIFSASAISLLLKPLQINIATCSSLSVIW